MINLKTEWGEVKDLIPFFILNTYLNMANINKIRISGTSYDIQDLNAASVSSLTQAQYDALPSTAKTSNTLFVITDAEAGDLTNYYTKPETNTLLGGKQATLVSGTNIKTINNENILGSGNIDIQGGSTYTAGRGIDITNDTISFSLPISAGTGNDSIIEGLGPTARGSYSHGEGVSTYAYGLASHSEGVGTIANNQSEHASGQYNVSNRATNTFGDSGNTLFSVGNGTSNNAKHNAFEIRQNGDIYLTLDGQDVKLQDHLGGGGSVTVDTELDSGSTNPVENRVIYNKIDEVEQVTAAGLNALNDNFGGLKLVKLTQAAYDALTIKDASTLYIILG